MPRKPAHPCCHPGCPNLTHERFCPEHQKEYNRDYEKYHRNRESRKKYGSQWHKIRKRFVAKYPWCEECLKRGIYTPVEHVHHRKPLSQGGTNDESNLESVCKACHSRIHARMGDRFKSQIK